MASKVPKVLLCRSRTGPSAASEPRRAKTHPNLLAGGGGGGFGGFGLSRERRVPAKVVVNVTVQRSPGPLQVVASTEWAVEKLVEEALKQYRKEGRRPLLLLSPPSAFGLHYSQFSLESLDPKEKLVELGSRNFFLCPKPPAAAAAITSTSSSCSGEADKTSKTTITWHSFMDLLM